MLCAGGKSYLEKESRIKYNQIDKNERKVCEKIDEIQEEKLC